MKVPAWTTDQSALVTSPYIDSEVASGSVYYYWVLSHPPSGVQQQSSNSSGVSTAISNPVRVATEFTDGEFGNKLDRNRHYLFSRRSFDKLVIQKHP